MSDDFLGESNEGPATTSSTKTPVSAQSSKISARQVPFLELIELFHKLFWELPNLTTRDVDERLQPMFDRLMDAAATAGISRNSVPSLKECCGKKRVWSDDPGKSQMMAPIQGVALPADEVRKVLGPPCEKRGLGDFFKKVFSFFGFKPCEGCERRRLWLNSIRWPWQKK